MTLPEQLRKWADNRERLRLDGRLLRRAAREIEVSRETIKKQYERIRELEDLRHGECEHKWRDYGPLIGTVCRDCGTERTT